MKWLSLCLVLLVACQSVQPYSIGWHYSYLPIVYQTRLMVGIAASGNGGAQAVKELGADFYLNWTSEPSIATTIEFFPILCFGAYPGCDTLPSVAKTKYIGGANEPNIYGQSAICPSDYVATWRQIESAFGDRKLVSPGVGAWGNIQCARPSGEIINGVPGWMWLEDFYEYYNARYDESPRWDALAFHCYPPPESPCNALTDTQLFIDLANRWNVDEVWITEFDSGKNGGQDYARAEQWLDYWRSEPKVKRAAYYQDNCFPSPSPCSVDGNNSAMIDTQGNATKYADLMRQ